MSGRRPASRARPGYFFVALYVVLLLLLGIAPTVYAIYLALSTSGGIGSRTSSTRSTTIDSCRRSSTSSSSMAIWLISQTVFVVGLALMLHNLARRVGAVFRFVFYIPGALAGAASVVVWLFMFDPNASPFALHPALASATAPFDNTIAPAQPSL